MMMRYGILMLLALGMFSGATFASEDEDKTPPKVEKAKDVVAPVAAADISGTLTPSQKADLTQMRIICEKAIAVGLSKRDEEPTSAEEKAKPKGAGKKKTSDGRSKDALEILKSLLNEDVTKEGGNKGKTKGQVMEEKLRKLIEGKTPAQISENFVSTLAPASVPAPAPAEGEEGAAKSEASAPSAVPEFKASYHGKWKKDSKDKAAGENQDFSGKMATYARCISMATAKRACAKTQSEPCGTALGRMGSAMGLGGAKTPKNADEAKGKAKGMLSGFMNGKK